MEDHDLQLTTGDLEQQNQEFVPASPMLRSSRQLQQTEIQILEERNQITSYSCAKRAEELDKLIQQAAAITPQRPKYPPLTTYTEKAEKMR